jgi:hypothetical protein
MIPTLIPLAAVGHSLQLILSKIGRPPGEACLQANLAVFVFDYIARQKLGGINFSYFVLKQLPILPPDTYTEALLDLIVPRVLELTYTAHDMEPFARDLGYEGPPFVWDEERRARLRAELDGIYAHPYGISRDDFAYILDTFPIVARKDFDQYGEYRTKRLCLEAYDHFSPETLRALEMEVREIETMLRRLIVRALDNDPGQLPSDLRVELLEQRSQHRGNRAGDTVPSLRDLLASAYMRQLDKAVRSDPAWPELESRFGPRQDFKRHIFRLNEFRNPLAHVRGVREDVRQGGEAAIAWFRERLDGDTPSSF